ncbi:hypothetical protein GGI24_004468, partial [Coemansia furcata]
PDALPASVDEDDKAAVGWKMSAEPKPLSINGTSQPLGLGNKPPWARRESTARVKDTVQTYLRVRQGYSRPRTQIVRHAASENEDCPGQRDYRSQAPYLDHWKLIYARILYKWEMDAMAVEVLKCIQDPDIRYLYNQLQCQPTVPQHDNLPRDGIAVIKVGQSNETPSRAKRAVDSTTPDMSPRPKPVVGDEEHEPCLDGADAPGAPWLSCSWCHEYVHGRALICHACGHGGHQEHMIRWFRIARKQLKRIGLAPVNFSRFGSSNSNSSSSSNLQLGLLGKGSSALTNIYSPELAPEPPLLSAILPEFTFTSPTQTLEDAADRALLLDMQPLGEPAVLDPSRRGSKGSVMSPMSSDSSAEDSDGDSMHGMGLLHSADDMLADGQEWDSRDVESDDHLLPHLSPSGAKSARQASSRLGLRRVLESSPQQQRLDEAFAMQLEIPTCPTGCGCNCIYESRRLIM